LSGEPAVPQLATWYSQQDIGPLPTTEFWELCQKRAEYLSEYQEYWNSSKNRTSSQRPVDGVILPVAANAAAKENSLTYFGIPLPSVTWYYTKDFAAYSAIVNLLDYSAGSFPVTKVDGNLDLRLPRKPFNEEDKSVWQQCKYVKNFFPTGQLIQPQMILKFLMELLLACKSCVGDFRKRKFWSSWTALPMHCLI
jgi:amidase